jgi:hypothetical protein
MQALSASGALLVRSAGEVRLALTRFWQIVKVGPVRNMRCVFLACAFPVVWPLEAQQSMAVTVTDEDVSGVTLSY